MDISKSSGVGQSDVGSIPPAAGESPSEPPKITFPAPPTIPSSLLSSRGSAISNSHRTDINSFLQQRSIQSFMFLLDQCRDPHTVMWLEQFGNHKNFLSYHGTGALVEHTWDGYFRELIAREVEKFSVSVKKKGIGHGGWSKSNPYLQEEWVDFEIEVEPVSLASRLLAVREQLALEWVHDLIVIKDQTEDVFRSYHEGVKSKKGESAGCVFDRITAKLLQNDEIANAGQSPLRCVRAAARGRDEYYYNLYFLFFFIFYVASNASRVTHQTTIPICAR